MSTVLAIPDQHFPFAHRDIFTFLQSVADEFSPDVVINLGDEIDAHALGDYDHDPDGLTAGKELEKALESLRILYKMFPNVSVCTSNHTARPYRRAFKYGIPKAFLRGYHEFLQAPKGWDWADAWEVDGVIYEHGEGFSGQNGAIKAAQANMQSTVIGHLHSWAGIQYSANAKTLIFGANAGCLIDRHQYAFAYGAKLKAKPILGCMIIIEGIPTFIPMLINNNHRWVKARR